MQPPLGALAVATVLALTFGASAYMLLGPAPAVGLSDAPGTPGDAATAERPSRVGLVPYEGPVTGAEVQAACATIDTGAARLACWTLTLNDLLEGKGAVAAFDALDELTKLDPLANAQGHATAHGVGRYAFDAYGTIGRALTNCSFKVFGGCVHGALQNYFDSLGRKVEASDIRNLCPEDPPFEEYTCLHGLGHGLMLNTNYDLHGTLELCAGLRGWFAQESCYGGVFMENWVGYLDSVSPTAAGGHQHGEGPAPVFFVNASDAAYPCNVVAATYAPACWVMQTSIILYFNGYDFGAAGQLCDGLANAAQKTSCFRSLGRDVGPYVLRQMPRAEQVCQLTPGGAADCVKGVVAEIVLNAADPMPGLAACNVVQHSALKAACYEEWAWQSVGMVGAAQQRRLCALADVGFEDDCLRGAQL